MTATAKKPTSSSRIKKTNVEQLFTPAKKRVSSKLPKKTLFNDVNLLRIFHAGAAIIAGGGLPIICYNVAHVQLNDPDLSGWAWNALFIAAISGFIFSSLTVFDLLSDWLESKVKAGAWVLVSEIVMLIGIEDWASIAVLGVLVVLNAGSVFVTLEKRQG